MPADAVQDKYDITLIYKKNDEEKEFTIKNLPDSTWQFVKQKKILVEKGRNNMPLINDFSLTATDGEDSTETILNKEHYYLFFIKSIDEAIVDRWQNVFRDVVKKAKERKKLNTPKSRRRSRRH